MIDRETTGRIVNFARWARTPRGAKLSACMSIEHRYRPERLVGDAREERSAPAPDIDIRDAVHVWRAINPTNGFPVRWYLAISARFIFRLAGYEFSGYMRRHGVPVTRNDDEHDRLVYEALSAARNVIRRADEIAWRRDVGYNRGVATGDGSRPLERLSASDQQRVA